MNIKTISFDEKSNAVTVSGPFDADKLCKKLCSEAGKVIRELHVKGKADNGGGGGGGGGDKPKAAKDGGKAEKDGGKAEKAKDAKPEKEGKTDKKDAGEKPKDAKPEKKVKFDDAPADAKPAKPMPQLPAGMTKADLGPLLEKMMQAKQGQGGGPPTPRGEPMMMAPPPAAAAQGVAVPSIWPAPAGAVSCYSYDPAGYGQPSYYGGGGGGGGCGGGCQCASCYRPPPPGGYYGVPVHDHQGWYQGNRHPYYQHQQPYCGEDPNAGCSVM
jgi:hypothetical protein